MSKRESDPNSLTVTVAECARMLGISRSQCYESLKSGEIPSRRIGSKYIISRHRIERWIDGTENEPPVESKLVALVRK